MNNRNKIARIMLAMLPAVFVLGFLNVSLGWTPANLEDQTYFGETAGLYDKDILVGAYYFPTGWASDGQIYNSQTNQPLAGNDNNFHYMYWTWIHDATQATWNLPVNTSTMSSGGLTHTFKNIDWEMKYIFDANQSTFPTGWTPWVTNRRSAYFKQAYGPNFGWYDGMNMHQPLSTTDGYLGEYNCDLSSVWQTQIENAAAYGIDFFAYEMFWNKDASDGIQKKHPHKPIDNGFLAAANRNKMRFAFMWVNGDRLDMGTMNYTTDGLNAFVDFLNTSYLNKSNYLKIDGKPVIYIYNIDKTPGGMKLIGYDANNNPIYRSDTDIKDNILKKMRDRAKYHGFKDLYIVGMGMGDYDDCGFDTITDYLHSWWAEDQHYVESMSNVQTRWTSVANANDAKFQPAVHTDVLDNTWNYGSRTYNGMAILNKFGMSGYDKPDSAANNGCSLPRFKTLLTSAKNFVNGRTDTDRIIMINAWNEWGEGNAVEPSQYYGWGHLESIREVTGFNPVVNWSLEDSGTTPWTLYNPGGGATFTKVSADKTKECTGLYIGRVAGANAPMTLAYQNIPNTKFTVGRTYRAWAKIKTTSVAGNGARLRMDFRYENDTPVCDPHESTPVTGTTSDFQRVSLTGTIPTGTHHIYIEVGGSTDIAPGANSVIEFDDVVLKSSILASTNIPSATISASFKYITGSGPTTVTWSTSNCASAQVWYRVNANTAETLWKTGTSGSYSFAGIAGNVYTFNVYNGTSHTRLLKSYTVVCYPATPAGYAVDNYNDGSYTGTTYYNIAGLSESNGTFKYYTNGTDPQHTKSSLSINTATYKKIKVRLKVIHGDKNGKIYWNNGLGWSESRSQAFTVNNIDQNGQWYEYTIDLTSNGYWTGTVTQFRLDPVTAMGALIEVDYIVATP